MTRLVRGGLEQFIENADTEAPRFLTLVDGMRNSPVKLGLDNPSNVYSTARVRGNAEYVVRGTRGTVAILSFGYQVRPRCGAWPTRQGASLRRVPNAPLTRPHAPRCARPATTERPVG